MNSEEIRDAFVKETKERLGSGNFDIYFNGPNEVALRGSFTSEQLRVVAQQLNAYKNKLAELAAAID